MRNDKSINLGSALQDRVEVLDLHKDSDGNFTWVSVGTRYAQVKPDERRYSFSSVGVWPRGVTVALRPCRLTLHQALRWKDQHLFLTAIIPNPARDRVEVKTAVCQPITFTAEPQAKTGRDELNRPTPGKVAAFTFPGVWAELYRREQDEGVVDTELVQRVIVTPKAVKLRRGDVIRHPDGTAWPVMRVLDMDEFQTEYIVYRQEEP